MTYSNEDAKNTGNGPFLDFPLPEGVVIRTDTSFKVNLDLAVVDKGSVWLDILSDEEDSKKQSGMRFRLIIESETMCKVRFRKKTPDQSNWQEIIDNDFDATVLKEGSNTIFVATTGTEYVTVVNGVELHLKNIVPVDPAVLPKISKIQIRLDKNNINIQYGKDCAVLTPGPGIILSLFQK